MITSQSFFTKQAERGGRCENIRPGCAASPLLDFFLGLGRRFRPPVLTCFPPCALCFRHSLIWRCFSSIGKPPMLTGDLSYDLDNTSLPSLGRLVRPLECTKNLVPKNGGILKSPSWPALMAARGIVGLGAWYLGVGVTPRSEPPRFLNFWATRFCPMDDFSHFTFWMIFDQPT